MKRKQRALLVLASAVATFGILFATMGKPNYGEHCRRMDHCDKNEIKTKNTEIDHGIKIK